MKYDTRQIRKAAVLGAGVMGAQIAAHLANAGIPALLFELPAKAGDPNGLVNKALKSLTRLKPAPLASPSASHAIRPANYAQHLELLADCDLVIEAIAERLDWKHDLYKKIAPHLGPDAVLATNTSGIGIAELAKALPAQLHERFCGVHFFNPPRYMYLVEVIAHGATRPDVLEMLEGFFTTVLGKGVIFARDTPNFIGNRIGVFSILAVMHHAERLGLAFDLVDKLTGPGIGRPKSATFRTADVVGLDTFKHVVSTMAQTLPDDPWHEYYRTPPWLDALVEKGALGQKTKAGVYKKVGRDIHVLEPAKGDYRRVRSALDDEVRAILAERDVAKKFVALTACKHDQAEFLRAIFRDLFHYCAVLLPEIAHNARDLDLTQRWGFGWRMGPFETWQAAGWKQVTETLADDITQGRAMTSTPLPDWVMQRDGAYDAQGAWSASQQRMAPRSQHPVYRRQAFPERVIGEPEPGTDTVFETDTVRLWHTGDDIAVLSFKTKMNTVSAAVLDGARQAIETAEKDFEALVLWQPQGPFCAGANLLEVITSCKAGQFDAVESVIANFQGTTMALKYSQVPAVAAVQGLALGGGCELSMHCDRVVAALESYIGLVEVGVGLVPAGGGLKELALRAAGNADGGDVFPFIAKYFERVAMGKVSTSASEARDWRYLQPADHVVFNTHELLYVAKQQAHLLFETGYRPPAPATGIPVAGNSGAATLQAQLVNMLEGGFISPHDYLIGQRLARAICGGDIDPGSEVDEPWLLRLEREAFMDLLKTEKTQTRIQHMLDNGRPLRN
ncbi:MAG: 3-hydroxyacyl-CoA dehydrogenase/enoyl-CoA hydratase family protein [Gammaproteobacteria bacterium]